MTKNMDDVAVAERITTLASPAGKPNGTTEGTAAGTGHTVKQSTGRRRNACGDPLPHGESKDASRLERFLCPVDEAARIVGQKWTLQIVHHLLDGRSRRFCELQEALGRVNPSTLSSRLKMLEEAGLVSRSQISDIPPHVEYCLTDMGSELRGVIIEITRWSNAHLCASSGKTTDAVPATHSTPETSAESFSRRSPERDDRP